jgi:excisionase family DNA binding protein
MEDLLTTKQLQELLQVDRVTIYRMLKEGRLEGFKVGGQWRFARHAIQRWLQDKQATLDRAAFPADTPAPSAVPQLLSSACMQAIQDIFAEALGVGAVITSAEGTLLTVVSHPCSFCQLILGTEAGRRRCVVSWQEVRTRAFIGSASRPATCHAGLNYLSAGIQVRDRAVAAIHAGQFLAAPSPALDGPRARLAELARVAGLDVEDLVRALEGVPHLDEARLGQTFRLLQRVAGTLAEMAEERLSLVERLQRISEISRVP